jgi:hypothetical protein
MRRMAIQHLPDGRLAMTCDGDGCHMDGPGGRVSEGQLTEWAEAIGWHIDREFGLHYCPLTTMHDCSVCGGPTVSSLTDDGSGEVTYYCGAHWPV